MKQYYIVCDIALCHNCNDCFMACKDEHVDNEWLPYSHAQPRHGHRWIDIRRNERGKHPRVDVAYLPMMCQHCADAPCVRAYPDCISRSEQGIVGIDPEKAKDRRELVDSCPYGAIWWNEEEGVAQKCTMCAHILCGECWDGGMPRCVHSCPTGALSFYCLEPAEMEERIRDEKLACWRPELSGGRANVYYKNLFRFNSAFIAGGLLKDGECLGDAEVRLRGADMNALCVTDCFGDFKFDGLRPGAYTVCLGERVLAELTLGSSSVDLGMIAV